MSNATMTMTMKTSQFAARYMQPDTFDEAAESVLNSVVLPTFLELLPKLSLGEAQQNILSDLLALLKHSPNNRDAFCETPKWHICMFGVVSRFVVLTGDTGLSTSWWPANKVCPNLEKWARHTAWLRARAMKRNNQFGKDGAAASKSALLKSMEEKRKYAGTLSQTSLLAAEEAEAEERKKAAAANENPDEAERDTWFAIGMKVYATLLLHTIRDKCGWHEVSRTISQAYDTGRGVISHFAVLSHFVNELTFTMQWRYRELQRLASSSDSAENNEAIDYLDNIFSVFITIGEHSLMNVRATTAGIKDWKISKMRVAYLKEVVAAKNRKAAEEEDSDDGTSGGEKEEFDEDHLNELAEAMLVERVALRRRRDSIAKAEVKSQGEDEIPHPEYSGNDIGLGGTTVTLIITKKLHNIRFWLVPRIS